MILFPTGTMDKVKIRKLRVNSGFGSFSIINKYFLKKLCQQWNVNKEFTIVIASSEINLIKYTAR